MIRVDKCNKYMNAKIKFEACFETLYKILNVVLHVPTH